MAAISFSNRFFLGIHITVSEKIMKFSIFTTFSAGCNREPFQIPNYYVIHIGGYSLLRHCPPGTFYIPRLCRCVTRRLVTILIENNPITARTDPSITKKERPRSSPGANKDFNPGVSTAIPKLTNSLAVKAGLFNVQSNDSIQTEIINPSKKTIKLRQNETKNTKTKLLVASSLKIKSRKSKSKSQKGKRERTKIKEEKSKVQKSLQKHENDHHHHISENITNSIRKEGPLITKLDSTRIQGRTLMDINIIFDCDIQIHNMCILVKLGVSLFENLINFK